MQQRNKKNIDDYDAATATLNPFTMKRSSLCCTCSSSGANSTSATTTSTSSRTKKETPSPSFVQSPISGKYRLILTKCRCSDGSNIQRKDDDDHRKLHPPNRSKQSTNRSPPQASNGGCRSSPQNHHHSSPQLDFYCEDEAILAYRRLHVSANVDDGINRREIGRAHV